ncbi:Uncharacterised protein [Bordetella pertussis]|nr:Uncharacterised protein [Bordetella pertussis]
MAAQVVQGHVERGARAGLDGHVAQGQAFFHRERRHRLAGQLQEPHGRAAHAELAQDMQGQVLGAQAGGQGALQRQAHRARAAHGQGLGRQHMLGLRGADAPGPGAQRPQRRGVAVATGHRHARQHQAQFGRDHVHDALVGVVRAVVADAGARGVGGQRIDHRLAAVHVFAAPPGRGGDDVVGDRHVARRTVHGAALRAQRREGLRAGKIVQQVPVDVDQAAAVGQVGHVVAVPQAVEQGARRRTGGAGRGGRGGRGHSASLVHTYEIFIVAVCIG